MGSGCLLFPIARPLCFPKTAPTPHGAEQGVIEMGTRGPQLSPDLIPSLSSTSDHTSSAPGCHYSPPSRAQHLLLPHRFLRVYSFSVSSASLSILASPWLGSLLQTAASSPFPQNSCVKGYHPSHRKDEETEIQGAYVTRLQLHSC